MKKLTLSALLFFLFTIPTLAGHQYRVTHVVDGDTIDIIYQGKTERIRMLCVDTPESVHPDQTRNSPLGKEASDYTKSRLTGKTVDLELETRTRGNYGRLLAYVIVDGENYSLELVREGWSRYYTKYGNSERYHAEFLAAEAVAKAKGIRVWAVGQTVAPPSPTKPQTAGVEYHGNVNSHKFHRPGCKHYDCMACTKVFTSKQEAVAAGYSPCGVCRP